MAIIGAPGATRDPSPAKSSIIDLCGIGEEGIPSADNEDASSTLVNMYPSDDDGMSVPTRF